MDELKIINDYRAKKSATEIAREHNTYTNKIIRILKKHNEIIRDKSETQKAAMKTGRSLPPMKGKKQKVDE